MSNIHTLDDIKLKDEVPPAAAAAPPAQYYTLSLRGRPRTPSPASPVESGGGEVPQADVASLAKAIEKNESKSKIAEKLKAAVKKLIRMQKMERTRKNRAASVIQSAARRRSSRNRARPRTPTPAPSPESDIIINIPEIPINYGGGILYAARATAAAAAAAVKQVVVAAGTSAVAVGTGIANLGEAFRDDMRRQKEELKELREKQEAEMRKQKKLEEDAERKAIENREAYEKDKARRERAKQKAEDAKQKAEKAKQAVRIIHDIEDVIDDAVKAPENNEPNAVAVFFANVGEAFGHVYANAQVIYARMEEKDDEEKELDMLEHARDNELCQPGQSCSDVMNRSPSVKPALRGLKVSKSTKNVRKHYREPDRGGGGEVEYNSEGSATPEEEHVAVDYGQRPPPGGRSSVVASRLRQKTRNNFIKELEGWVSRNTSRKHTSTIGSQKQYQDVFILEEPPIDDEIRNVAEMMGPAGINELDAWYERLTSSQKAGLKSYVDKLKKEYRKVYTFRSKYLGGSIRNTRNKRLFNRHTRR